MIPPNAMERARLAFWNEDGNLDMKLNAAFRSLSAAWPVADKRIREEAERWVASFWTPDSTMDGASPEAQALVRAVLDRAALSPPSAPAADVRIVRVAVASDARNKRFAEVIDYCENDAVEAAWHLLDIRKNARVRLCIAEIPVPVRDVPTVRAKVEAPHE